MIIPKEQFENIVTDAIESLPDKFKTKIYNVAIFVEDFPTLEQMRKVNVRNKYGLFGLYEGYHQASRRNVGPVLPDRITIFRVPIMSAFDSPAAAKEQIIRTVKHEIAHHFGSDEHGARKAGG